MAFFNRWTRSGEVFGYFEDWHKLNKVIEIVGLATRVKIPIEVSYASALQNTLVVTATSSKGANIEVLFAARGVFFDVNVVLAGGVTAEFAGFEVDFGNLEFRRDGFFLTVGGERTYYQTGNLSRLKEDSLNLDRPMDEDMADSLVAVIRDVTSTIGAIETWVKNAPGQIKELDYSPLDTGVDVDLPSGLATALANGTPADIGEIRDVIATSFDDTITGTGGANVIDGGAGIDIINAGGGNDTITGGAGEDELSGGSGFDTYIVDNGDKITDSDGDGKAFFNGSELKGGEL